ncbi:MAG: hypothetical protein E6J89_18015 [Deltaproteobacteria bacterium]|nr:MAG: hypothetical protein E6J89_18015 [Deltaproteobacteria bacterium]
MPFTASIPASAGDSCARASLAEAGAAGRTRTARTLRSPSAREMYRMLPSSFRNSTIRFSLSFTACAKGVAARGSSAAAWGSKSHVERNLCPPWGIGGGESGKPARALVRQSPEDPGRWVTKGRNTPVRKGGVVTFFTAGGGGYGAPAERAPALIERDRTQGYVKP